MPAGSVALRSPDGRTMSAVRIAAIGLQHQHIFSLIDGLLRQPGVELGAVAEPDEARRAAAAARYGVTAYADHRDLLAREEVAIAAIAPINREKPGIVADCAAAGVHVFADKPTATTLEGLDRIAAAVAEHGILFYMAATGGYGQSVGWKRLIDAGALGQLVHFVNLAPHRLRLRPGAGWTRPAWSVDRDANGGLIADLAVHGVNMWRYLSGAEVAEIAAVHGNRRFPEHPTFEDHASVYLTMTDGSTAFLAPSWLTPDAEPSHGRGATYVIGTDGQLEVTSPGVVHGLEQAPERHATVLTTAAQPPHAPAVAEEGPSAEADFVDAVRTGRQPRVSAPFLIESQRIALLARDAADQRRSVRVR
jgi:predicted dehydrogenase